MRLKTRQPEGNGSHADGRAMLVPRSGGGKSNKSDRADGIHILDSLDRSQAVIEFEPTGDVIRANHNFLAVTGYQLDEIVGQHHRIFVDRAEAADPSYREFWDSLRRGEFQSAEFRRISKTGNEIWIQATYNPVFDDDGNVYKIVKFATDITSQKQAEQQTQDRTQAVIDFLPDGTILRANALFLKTMGTTLDEIRGQHHRIFMPPGEAETDTYREFWRALAAGEFRQGQFHRVDALGNELWLQGAYSPIFGSGGAVVRVTKSAVDITEETKRKQEAEDIGRSIANSVVEMSHAIGEISQSMNNTSMVASTVEAASSAAATRVSKLENVSNTISKVTDTITGLSQQSHLLALNATIEAARAGEYGKGFGVVASEVKDLASQTSTAAGDIQARIESIQTEIASFVSAIQEITESIGEFTTMTSSVAASVEEQSTLMEGMNAYAGHLLDASESR